MHWLHSLWFHYCWPSLTGNGPEAAIELIGLAILSSLLYPPVRKWIARGLTKIHKDVLDAHPMHKALGNLKISLDSLHAKHGELDAKHQELLGFHEKLLSKHDDLLAKHEEILTHLKPKPKTPAAPKPSTGRVTPKGTK
jgi:hypothetical protein